MRGAAIAVLMVLSGCATAATTTTPATAPSEPNIQTTSRTGMTCWSNPVTAGGSTSVVFEDKTESLGLVEPLIGMHGHAAVWTDLNGDELPDLFVGSFADRPDERYQFRGATGPSPDQMLTNDGSGFTLHDDFPSMFTRTSGGVSADLDGDGDLDLVLSRNYRDNIEDQPTSEILENVDGSLRRVSNPGIRSTLGARSIAVFDYDFDGLLDLFITEDHWSGGRSVLLHNEGELQFIDSTADAGLPLDIHGLGVAAADLNGDRKLDLFVSGSNRLFVADDDHTFSEAANTVFAWEAFGPEDDIAGVSVADVNNDGLLDIAIGHHFNSTIENETMVQVRLYLNQTSEAGTEPAFIDVTDESGLTPLSTKAPHVELNDFNNDGLVDLLTSASAEDGDLPALFVQQALNDSVPAFDTPAGLGDPQYWVAAPSVDYDRDGRLDVFLVEWEPAVPSILLHNETVGAHWLEVSVDSENGFGLGWRVEVYESGSGGSLLGAREITVTQGYSAGVLPIAHFGLGDQTEVSVRLVPPGDIEPITLKDVAADQHLRYPAGCD